MSNNVSICILQSRLSYVCSNEVTYPYLLFFRCKHFNGAVGKGATRNVVCARRVTGRYVYVMLRGTNWLTLCEVVVFGKRLGRYNYL